MAAHKLPAARARLRDARRGDADAGKTRRAVRGGRVLRRISPRLARARAASGGAGSAACKRTPAKCQLCRLVVLLHGCGQRARARAAHALFYQERRHRIRHPLRGRDRLYERHRRMAPRFFRQIQRRAGILHPPQRTDHLYPALPRPRDAAEVRHAVQRVQAAHLEAVRRRRADPARL